MDLLTVLVFASVRVQCRGFPGAEDDCKAPAGQRGLHGTLLLPSRSLPFLLAKQ